MVQEYLRSFWPNKVSLHPPYSPDLNPIENLGSLLKKIIKDLLRVRDILVEEIFKKAWRIVGDDTEMLHSLVESMQCRYQHVIDSNGNVTRYLYQPLIKDAYSILESTV